MSLPAYLANLTGLCRFRRGPEDMPYAPPLLIALLVGCGLLDVLFGLYQGATGGMLVAALLGGLAALGVVFALLRWRGKVERFVQTATALSAVYLSFGIVTDALALTLPLKVLREQFFAHPEQPPTLTGVQTVVVLVVSALGIWQLCVWVRILRLALELPLVGAILVFLLLLFVDWLVTGMFAAAVGAAA